MIPAVVCEPAALTTILLSDISTIVEFIIVCIPFTLKLPDTIRSLLTVTLLPVISSL